MQHIPSRFVAIDGTYRNTNGMKMQLANPTMIRQKIELYRQNHEEFQVFLKEAIR